MDRREEQEGVEDQRGTQRKKERKREIEKRRDKKEDEEVSPPQKKGFLSYLINDEEKERRGPVRPPFPYLPLNQCVSIPWLSHDQSNLPTVP